MNHTAYRRPNGTCAGGHRLKKLIGSDTELGNFILGGRQNLPGLGGDASRAVLREVDGLPRHPHINAAIAGAAKVPDMGSPHYLQNGYVATEGNNPRDWGRRYLRSNGGCIYIDLNHLELCTPEVLGAREFVAVWNAMLIIAGRARDAANQRLPAGQRIVLLANNSDGRGSSYGGHLNFLISRHTWDNMFHNRMYPHLFFLMAYQVSSIVFTGQGKVGAENNRPAVSFQLSQRADFFETLVAEQTTFRRPLVNSRDEALCGGMHAGAGGSAPSAIMARLHVIFYDTNLAQVATFLKVGVMQIVLAMCEAECMDSDLILEDPLDAVLRWSHDPDLRATARVRGGNRLTAVELQLLFLARAKDFIGAGDYSVYIPEVDRILALWEDTLLKLQQRDFDALGSRLDWVMKRALLERVLDQSPRLNWDSPELKHLDLIYSSIDNEEGLFWSIRQDGRLEHLVSEGDIEHSLREPPTGTRAWGRTMLLRALDPGRIIDVNWDRVRFTVQNGAAMGHRSVEMANPLEFTKQQTERFFRQ